MANRPKDESPAGGDAKAIAPLRSSLPGAKALAQRDARVPDLMARAISGPNTDHEARLDALRRALAQAPVDSEARRALHLAIAEAIQVLLPIAAPGSPQRSLKMERAFSLYHALEYAAAGRAFEKLELWDEAERAYREGGLIEELEYIYFLRQSDEQRVRDRRDFEAVLDEAFLAGRRQLALEKLNAAVADIQIQRSAPELVERLQRRIREIRARSLKSACAHLLVRQRGAQDWSIRIWYRNELRIGRSPGVELSLPHPTLSREHAAIRAVSSGHGAESRFELDDLGSRSGTFLEGDAVDPSYPVPLADFIDQIAPPPQDIGLGFDHRIWVLRYGRMDDWALAVWDEATPFSLHILAPQGAPLCLPPEPRTALGQTPAAQLRFDVQHRLLQWRPDGNHPTELRLNGHRVSPGDGLELLIDDQLEMECETGKWTVELKP